MAQRLAIWCIITNNMTNRSWEKQLLNKCWNKVGKSTPRRLFDLHDGNCPNIWISVCDVPILRTTDPEKSSSWTNIWILRHMFESILVFIVFKLYDAWWKSSKPFLHGYEYYQTIFLFVLLVAGGSMNQKVKKSLQSRTVPKYFCKIIKDIYIYNVFVRPHPVICALQSKVFLKIQLLEIASFRNHFKSFIFFYYGVDKQLYWYYTSRWNNVFEMWRDNMLLECLPSRSNKTNRVRYMRIKHQHFLWNTNKAYEVFTKLRFGYLTSGKFMCVVKCAKEGIRSLWWWI